MREELYFFQFRGLIEELDFFKGGNFGNYTFEMMKQLLMYNFFHGEQVYEHDSVANTVYFIQTGVVKIFTQNGFSFETYSKGCTFGDAEVFTYLKRIGTAKIFTAQANIYMIT